MSSSVHRQVISHQYRELRQVNNEHIISSGEAASEQIAKTRNSSEINGATRFDGKISTLKEKYPTVYKGMLRYFQMYIIDDIKKRHGKMMDRIKQARQGG